MAKIDIPSTRPLIDKLNVKPDSRVSVLFIEDASFLALLESRTPYCTIGKARKGSDLIFLGTETTADLARIAPTIACMKQNGAMWIVYPKGLRTITEAAVREAGLAAGLVDNKVVSFSATHTALRFVIPVAKRK